MLKFLRIGVVLFACFVMWFKPNSGIDFFRSLIILSMGYAYDYCAVLFEARIPPALAVGSVKSV